MFMRQEVRNSVGLVNQPPHPTMTALDWRFKMLTYEEVSELLEYRPEVGGSCLIRKVPSFSGKNKIQARAGDLAGTPDPNRRYWRLRVFGKMHRAHKLVWLLNTKEWPAKNIDHKDGDPENNTFDNLRLCTQRENSQNRKKSSNNTSGFLGVHWSKQQNKWVAQISHKNKKIYLGRYETPEAAYNAYLAAKAELHTFNPVPR